MAMPLTNYGFSGKRLASARSRIAGRSTPHLTAFFTLRLVGLSAIAVAGLLVITACTRAPQTTQSLFAGDEWHDFQGTWTAAGSRISIPLR